MQQPSSTNFSILIIGANGQLGTCFKTLAPRFTKFHFIFADRDELDICDWEAIEIFFALNNIACVVNCAAYTAVDKAETEKELALAINATAVGYLATKTAELNIPFFHISTDYVFDGNSEVAYLPADETIPVNYYGYTKLEGEKQAIKNNPQSIIIRTAWVYSEFGNNFVKTMLRFMSERDSINVVADQFGVPTYALDLANAIMFVIDNANFKAGVYHYSNSGKISWYNFAEAIAKYSGSACRVNGIPTSAYPTPAKRPSFSLLNTESFTSTFKIEIRDWELALKECLTKLV
jgi:dTDP-4-dehydrorhamnose reductase